MSVVELRITAHPAYVRTARQVAVTLARRAGLDDKSLDEVRLAVGEATGLAVTLAAQDHAAPVRVAYDDGDGFVVEVAVAVSLPAASGPEVAEVLDGAVADGPPLPPDADLLPAGSAVMVLTSLVPQVALRTGAEGLRVRLAWPPDASARPAVFPAPRHRP